MSFQLIPIAKLNPDQMPVTLKAVIKNLYPAPQRLVTQEGRLKDESGEVAFTVWKDSGIKGLRVGRQYVFHRVGLGMRGGRLEVRLQEGCRVFAVKSDKDLKGVLKKIARREQSQRERLLKDSRQAARPGGSRKKGIYSILITAGLFLWAVAMVLHFMGILTEDRIKDFIKSRMISRQRKEAFLQGEGEVKEVIDGGSVVVRLGNETWLVRYLGLEFPSTAAGEDAKVDPRALRALNYNRYLVEGKTVHLEFEEGAPPPGREVEAYVFQEDKMINVALLERGLARLRRPSGNLKYEDLLERAEDSARSARLGIWRSSGGSE